MTDPLDAELDRLFRLPPAEFVEARDALAANLRKAGDAAGAARVKALKRPTPAAWALNQLHFAQSSLLDRVQERAGEVRALHARDSVDPRALWGAVEALRSATNSAVDAAIKRCQEAGLPHGLAHQRKILSTVQGWLSGSGAEAPGRMTQDLEASGFDALPTLGAAAAREPAPRPPVVEAKPAPGASKKAPAGRIDPRLRERALAELKQREQDARAARERVRQRRAYQERAQQDLGRAHESVAEAERALLALRAHVAQREGDLARAIQAVEEAEQALQQTEELAARAHAALGELRHEPER